MIFPNTQQVGKRVVAEVLCAVRGWSCETQKCRGQRRLWRVGDFKKRSDDDHAAPRVTLILKNVKLRSKSLLALITPPIT